MIRAYDEYGNVVDLVKWEKYIRAKAIDEFVEELKARSIKVSTVKSHTYLKAVGTKEIDKIAQQMKNNKG